ncbi:hypothetical protein MVEN_00437300 [Mycena venus]|uniref:Uncharacterized protein n=1 Tax=Mycena venus TaxID=2733690 RepID=A0A8H7DAJ0_9AGAR|nr:hypothetical protein MVEN_00437300 [Mycena venus]
MPVIPAALFDTAQAIAHPFGGIFIHPPFSNLPGGVVLTAEGMNYSVMDQYPTWFLDVKDYITLDASLTENAIPYPRELEPPASEEAKGSLAQMYFLSPDLCGCQCKKAWSDTATSSRRQSSGKTAVPATLLPIDTVTPVRRVSFSTSTSAGGNKSPSTTVPVAAKPASTAAPKAKPGPKPRPKLAKPASPAKAKKVGVDAPGKIVIPAQKPKPKPSPPPTPWVKSLSPPPPVGVLPPRMRPFPRKSFRISLYRGEEEGSEDADCVQTDKQVADLLLLMDDVDMLHVDEPDEYVDMELEDEEEGLHPPISLGGLVEPMFGVENPFSLSSRPQGAVANNAVANNQSSSQSRMYAPKHSRPGKPPVDEEEEPLPLGRFKVSSLAYLIDKNLSVSPPHSPAPRPLTPPPTTDMDEEPTATMFAAMQDVFVLKMQKMDPELKAKFLGHLQEQFGVRIQVKGDAPPPPLGASEDSVPWATLPESVVKQIMSEHERSAKEDYPDEGGATTMTMDDEFTALADDFKQDSAGQLKSDLEDQLKALVGVGSAFTAELAGPLQDALTLQLKDEIIVQVAGQMMEALVVQGEEAQVEFEWRRRFLERQLLWAAADEENDGLGQEDVIQHPLHHLFLSKATPADMDVRMPASLICQV